MKLKDSESISSSSSSSFSFLSEPFEYPLLSILLILILLSLTVIFPSPKHHQEAFGGGKQQIPLYQPTSWSALTCKGFLDLQQQLNPDVKFDLNMLQRQATQDDADFFLKHQHWYWPSSTVHIYNEFVKEQSSIKLDPTSARRQRDQSIYPNQGILLLMATDSKEGRFLIDGVQLPPKASSSSSPDNVLTDDTTTDNATTPFQYGDYPLPATRTLKCMPSSDSTNPSSDLVIVTAPNKIEKIHDYASLPYIVPGFSFLDPNQTPCNPCTDLDDPFGINQPQCRFKIDVGQGDGNVVSDPWRSLWKLPDAHAHDLKTKEESREFDKWYARIFPPRSSKPTKPPKDFSGNEFDPSYNLGINLGIAIMFQESIPTLPYYSQSDNKALDSFFPQTNKRRDYTVETINENYL